MKNKIRGISLIALIITLAIIIIIAATTIQNAIQRTDQAKLAKHNTNISIAQEEVESYYYYKSGHLPTVNQNPYIISTGSTLEAEIIKNDEQSDVFYILDLSKLEKVSGKDGTGVEDDIYIVSAVKHNVYYVKGTIVKGVIYHGLNPGNMVQIAQSGGLDSNVEVTLAPSPTLTPSPTPAPGSGDFDGYVNSPKISAGMIPIKWSGSSAVDLSETEKLNLSNEWYDYHNTGATLNRWANIRLQDGSILVWIPRYTYKITSGEHAAAGTIDIKFSNGTVDDTTNGYRVHPAFYWGGWNIPVSTPMTKVANGIEITGIWVAKFESSNNSSKVQIVQNSTSWTSLDIGSIFTTCRAMQTTSSSTYGISTDTNVLDVHMLKNSEWGAIAYLSKYALGATEVAINLNTGRLTANGAISSNIAQSTTGNVYGIYDMSGCSYEYVSAYLNNNTANLTGNGNSIKSALGKYKDIFPKATTDSNSNNYVASNNAYGHAIYETSTGIVGSYGWFSDYIDFPEGTVPFFIRGGYYSSGSLKAGLFYVDSKAGFADVTIGFRPTIVVI